MNVYLNKVTDIYRTGMPLKSRGPFICFCSNNSKSIIPLKKFDDEKNPVDDENYVRFYDTHELNDIDVNGYVDVNGYLIADGTVIAGEYINISGHLYFDNMIKCTDLNVNFLSSSGDEVDVDVSGDANVNVNGDHGGDYSSIVLTGSGIGNIDISGNLTTSGGLSMLNCNLTVGGDANIGNDNISIITGSGNIDISGNLTTSGGLNMSYCTLTVSGDANIGDIISSRDRITISNDLYLNSKSGLIGDNNAIINLNCRNLYSTSRYLPFIDTNITCTNIENTNQRCSLSLNNGYIKCSNINIICDSDFDGNIYYPNITLYTYAMIDLRINGNYESSITCENIYVEQTSAIYLYDSIGSKIYATYIRSTNSDSKELNIYMNNPDCFEITADHIQSGITLIKYYYDSILEDRINGTMV